MNRMIEDIEVYLIQGIDNLSVLLLGLIPSPCPFYLFSIIAWVCFHLTK